MTASAELQPGGQIRPDYHVSANSPASSGHLIALSQGQWALWNCGALRGAGFPAAGILKLSAPACAAVADRLIQAEDRAEKLWAQSIEALRRDVFNGNADERPPLIRSLRKLRKGKLPRPLEAKSATGTLVNEFQAACNSVTWIWTEYAGEFRDAELAISRQIQQIKGLDRFREALVWQNRNALHTGIDAHLSTPIRSNSDITGKRRKRQGLVANYWQRYCAKNDSVGFFGPIGWLRLDSNANRMSVRPGPELISGRTVYFELWCIRAMAEKLSQERDLRLWLPPSLSPVVHFDGDLVHLPLQEAFRLSPRDAAIIRLCDGNRSALQIAFELLRDPALEFGCREQVYDRLDGLAERRIISWGFRIPPSPYPERILQSLVERVGEAGLRARALRHISELEARRRQVADAAGDPDKLDVAMAHLEETFSGLTGVAPTRHQGSMYAGRTLVYEDCVRDVDVEIGGDLLTELGPPLSLLLESARWLTSECASRFRVPFQQLYEELHVQFPTGPIAASLFWARAQGRLFGPGCRIVGDLLSDFQERWARLLGIDESAKRLQLSSADLRAGVKAEFEAQRAGWKYARYHSPDVMIAAESVDAINQGEYLLVLGEMHAAINTLSNSLFVCQHPDAERMYEWLERDQPEPRIVPVHPRHAHTTRGALMLVSEKDYRLEFDAETPGAERGRRLPIGSLVVDDKGTGVFVRSLLDPSHFDIIEVFADFLTSRVMNGLKVVGPRSHNPRVTIDRLVVCRESWTFDPSELEFAFERDEAHRFLAVRRWVRDLALPRFVFFKSPVEVKPCFLDFASPIFVNIFAKLVRQAAHASSPGDAPCRVGISEMLPAPDQVWLADSSGNTYSSELRLVAVDLVS